MTAPIIIYFTYIAFFLFFTSLAFLVINARESGEVVQAGIDREAKPESILLRFLVQGARAIAPLFQSSAHSRGSRDIERLLRRAGQPMNLTVPEYHALKVVGGLVGLGFGWFAGVAVWNEPSPILMFVMAIFGFIYPGTRINALMEQRMLRIFRDMPYVLEMLTLSTEAGQDFSSAMATVIEKGVPGPLLDEFRIGHQEIMLGKRRSDALRGMATRIDLPEVTSFILALIQAEQLGTSIGKVLRTMAEQMRIKRSTLAEEAAGKVPVKMMLPLMLCIVPAAFIILLFGPIYMYMTGMELPS